MAGAKKNTSQQRVFSGEQKVHHDLFKLTVAEALKNVSWTEVPDYVKAEHCHMFHTFDSDGRPQTLSTSIAGHFHVMKIESNGSGIPKVTCESGPMKFVRKKVQGRWKKVMAPVNDADHHRHDTVYIKSDEIAIRKPNMEAVNVVAHDAQKTAPIAGVQG